MLPKIKNENLIIFSALFALWMSALAFDQVIPILLLALIVVSLRLIFLYRNIQIVFIFCIFHLSYTLILIPYFLFSIPIVPYTEFQIPEYMNETLLIHALFVIALYLFTDIDVSKRKTVFSENLIKRENPVVFMLLVLAMLALIYTFARKQNVYSLSPELAFQAYVGNIAGASGAPEYFIVFFLAGFLFAKKFFSKLILMVIFVIYSYFAFTRGMRVPFLMLILLFFALFLDGKTRTRYILLLVILGMFVFQAVGFLRDGRREIAELFTIYSGEQILTNQSEVFYTSNVIISSLTDNIFGLKQRLFSLFAASLQVILPPRLGFVVEGKPALYMAAIAGRAAGGGGLISAFFYFWGSYPGVVLIAYFIASITNLAIKRPSVLLSIYIICVYSFYPRWLAYDPINFLFRLPFYACGLYIVLGEFHSLALKRKTVRKIVDQSV